MREISLKKVVVIMACQLWFCTIRLQGNELNLFDQSVNPFVPSTYFIPLPTDIVPMSLAAEYVLLHNYLITMDSKNLYQRAVDKTTLDDYPFLSEAIKDKAQKSAEPLFQKGQMYHINIGFQYFTWRRNWYIYFERDEKVLDFELELPNGSLFERWHIEASGMMFGTSFPFIRSHSKGYIAAVVGLGYLWQKAFNEIGSERHNTYHNQFGYAPIHSGIIAEWNQLKIVNINFWTRFYYPAYIGSKNEIDRQLSSVDSWLKYGVDIRGHIDLSGLGIQTSLSTQARQFFKKVRFRKESEEAAEGESLDPTAYTYFNLSVSVPFEFKKH